jgi:hypothetical protein
MNKLLFTVVESFNITGRGVSAISDKETIDETFRSGDLVELVRPDGRVCQLKCYQEILCRSLPEPGEPPALYAGHCAFTFMGIDKADIPPGTTVFQLVEHVPPPARGRKYEKIEKKPM